MLTLGSLFSGYGGLDHAVEAVLDARTAWVADIDPGACKVLAHRYPDVPNLGDVTTIDWSAVEPVDIITGGSPCQDLSTAGRRAGMTEGTRSNLWVAMREAIANVKPRFVVWENVRGSLSAHAASDLESCPGCVGNMVGGGQSVLRALGRVLGDLADLGYDAEWRGIRASDVGACHQRFRVFVLAWRRDAADPHGAGLQGQRHPQGAAPARRYGHAKPGAGGLDLVTLPTPRATDGTKGGPNQRGSSGDLMLPSAVAQLLPTPAAGAFNDGEDVEAWTARRERVKAELGNGNGFGMPLGIAVAMLPTPKAGDADFGLPRTSGRPAEKSTHLATRLHYTNFDQYAAAIARHERMLGRPAPSPVEPGRNGKPRLSAEFASWMMGLPDGWVTDVPGVSRAEALKMLGNGVVPQQAAAALTDMLTHAIDAMTDGVAA